MKKLKRVYTQNIDNLEEIIGLELWNFESVKNCQAQVVQLHGKLANLQCKVFTNVYSFTMIFLQKEKLQIALHVKKENSQGKNKETET
ncbi:Sir2 NAD+-dependent protein deacetylase [Gigaspora margarita]|uniref:Sir2 NAD+-dependent protein deacetylase n=1 Tax=Gigaspora margarita TaxID=4874 RepID=A0A8H4AW66_GIGMA|nr:Sir2 NAD+-dependent protein deacetylase [Gigaspora margarita]